jgi:hypothetical protein
VNIYSKRLFSGLLTIALVVLTGDGFAQASDIDHPIAMTSRVLTGNLVGASNGEHFYSFYAEKGSFTVTIDVTTTHYSSGLDATLMSNANSGSGFAATASNKGSGRGSKTFQVAQKKKILMKLTDVSASDGTYKLTLSGDVSLPK